MSAQKLFGSSGIRGDAKELFTDQFCFDLGRSFASLLDRHQAIGSVAVGMDPRESSPRIMSALITGLRQGKRTVYNEGILPIPAINWVLRADKSVAGSIMVTGSHIKAHLNGLKFFAFGDEILKEHEQEIQEIYDGLHDQVRIEDSTVDSETQILTSTTHRQSYIDYLFDRAEKSKSLKIVLDAGNGAQSVLAPEILRKLGHNVIEMFTNTNGELLSRDTEVSGDFEDLQKRLLEEQADLGIGFDSDGDRIIFIDEKGNFIPGDYSGTLIAKGYDTETVVTPINTSQVIDHIGKKVIRTKVGSPFVVGKMQESGATFGFEANGGGIFSDMYSRDGGRSMIEFLDLIHKTGLKVSELVATIPKFYILRDKVDYDWSKKDEIIEAAKKHFTGENIEELDGLKIWLSNDTWILFRSSANAPEFRVFVESPDFDKSNSLLAEGMALVKNYTNS